MTDGFIMRGIVKQHAAALKQGIEPDTVVLGRQALDTLLNEWQSPSYDYNERIRVNHWTGRLEFILGMRVGIADLGFATRVERRAG